MISTWNIKKRVFCMTLLPTILITTLLSVYFIVVRFNEFEEDLLNKGKATSQQLSRVSRYAILSGNQKQLNELTQIALSDHNINSIAIFDKEKRLLAFNGTDGSYDDSNMDLKNKYNSNPSVVRHNQHADFLSPIMVSNFQVKQNNENFNNLKTNDVIGWISINFSHDEIALKKYKAIVIVSVIAFLGLLLSIVLAMNLNAYLLIPIRKIMSTVKRIKHGQFKIRLDIEGNGELADLARDINEMTNTLQKMKNEEQEHIVQATSDLNSTLEALESQNIELNIAKKEAQKASKVKSEFIANMSHEIKTPMNCIMGFSQLLLETTMTDTQKDYLLTIKQSSQNLLALTNNILDFSRLETGKLKLENTPMNLRSCLEDVLRSLAPRAHTKQLELTYIIYDDVPENVLGDPLRIKQILTNLIGNSIKFSEDGSIVVRVSVEELSLKNATISISISDTGIGISEENQKNLFNAFQHTNPQTSEEFGGTGLGLVLTKKLIDLMHGSITVNSTLNKGSTFCITFTTNILSHKYIEPSNSINFKQRKIWLHEQNLITRFATINHLKKWKLHCDETTNLDELNKMLENLNSAPKKYELIILGMHKTMNFDKFNQEILSKVSKHCQTPILVMSNSSEPHLIQNLKKSGATECLPKPCFQQSLLTIVQKILENNHASGDFLATEKISVEPQTLRGLNILSVDDNPHNNNLVKTILERQGAKVTTASDGNYAIILANKHDYDIVLMDLRMPNLDGVQATRFIRKPNCRNYQKPIIAVSAHITATEESSLLSMGFSHYITKPIDKKTIAETILGQLDPAYLKNKFSENLEESIFDKLNMTYLDLELSKKLAGGKEKLAIEMLAMLSDSLPADIAAIEKAYNDKNPGGLLEAVHRFHGAICYAGAPTLKDITEIMESSLKNKEFDRVDTLFDAFMEETNHVQREITELLCYEHEHEN